MDTTTSIDHINTTANPISFSSDYYDNLKYSLHIMSLCVYGVACVLGVLGNGVVIWVTGFRMKKTVNTVWFLNLAVADFLFTAFLPLSITYQGLNFHWVFGKFMCKLNSTVSFLNLFASVYTLVVISVDSLPHFVFRDTEDMDNSIICYNNYALSNNNTNPSVIQLGYFRHRAMTITRVLLGFIIPYSIIVFCYAIIFHRIRSSPTLAKQSSRPFKIIAAIIITFFLCWAPFHLMTIIELKRFDPSNKSETLLYVITIGLPLSTSLAFVNSCLNPILYVFMGQDFKDKFSKSILKMLETAFHDDEASTCMKSLSTSKTKTSDHSTAV
ncbi:hypothetical protein XENOCAPTIV_010770 [Xenoophorus captivus]|uniref:G-protein coupled receptors family 1 profile domain-containing protein n=1 Tax=Xenoophorus captivus TaxID=1517983 RepID=A0ABV0R9D7_9TELE